MENFEKAFKQYQKTLDIKQENSQSKSSNESDNHSEGLILINKIILYKKYEKEEKAIQAWKNAL